MTEKDTSKEQSKSSAKRSEQTPMDIVKKNMLWSGGAGLIPMPLVEFVAVSGLQVKLIKELSEYYDVPFKQELAKSIVISLVGSLGGAKLAHMFAASSIRVIPFVGHAISALSLPAMSAGLSYAIGKIFIAHFEAGGTLLSFDTNKAKTQFKEFYEQGVKKAVNLKDKIKSKRTNSAEQNAAL
jgi:uncharacterized protein (DUF697 family)